MEKVDHIQFGTHILDVYRSTDSPLFKLDDIVETLNLRDCFTAAECCESDELIYDSADPATYVTETGLFNILAHTQNRIARMWRRVIFDQLIEMRKAVGRSVTKQFEVWDRQIDELYFDEINGNLMRSVTVPGGDVVQVPVE